MPKFYGKYRGKVGANIDPLELGRIQVKVPAVLGNDTLSWAMPCVPYAGPQVGFLAMPPIDANIWVEFECGDPSYPIWSGCFWGEGELPQAELPLQKILKTETISLLLDDTPEEGGVSLDVEPPAIDQRVALQLKNNSVAIYAAPANLKVAPTGIQISLAAASVQLSEASVNINNGALEVM